MKIAYFTNIGVTSGQNIQRSSSSYVNVCVESNNHTFSTFCVKLSKAVLSKYTADQT